MTTVPQQNANLTSIRGGGFTHDYRDTGDVPQPSKWVGYSSAYLRTRIVSTYNSGGGLDRVRETTLFVDSQLLSELGAGDYLYYTYLGQDYVAKVKSVVAMILPGSPSYARVYLEEINAA